MSKVTQLTPLQRRVLEEIRQGNPSGPKGFPRTYHMETPELEAAIELAELGYVVHDSSDHPAGWYLTEKAYGHQNKTAPAAEATRADTTERPESTGTENHDGSSRQRG